MPKNIFECTKDVLFATHTFLVALIIITKKTDQIWTADKAELKTDSHLWKTMLNISRRFVKLFHISNLEQFWNQVTIWTFVNLNPRAHIWEIFPEQIKLMQNSRNYWKKLIKEHSIVKTSIEASSKKFSMVLKREIWTIKGGKQLVRIFSGPLADQNLI